jgi:hypothetical protein
MDGVPALLNGINSVFGSVIAAQALSGQILSLFEPFQQQWGVYSQDDDSQPVLTTNGFVSFGIQNQSQVANYRIEKGQFSAYNKVDSPYQMAVTLTKAGQSFEIKQFLDKLDEISNDFKLYKVFTPDKIYENANMESYSYERTVESGLNIIYATIIFTQILSTAEVAFNTPTKTVAGQKVETIGTVGTKQ